MSGSCDSCQPHGAADKEPNGEACLRSKDARPMTRCVCLAARSRRGGFEPLFGRTRSRIPEQRPEQDPEHPVTSNHERITKSQHLKPKKENDGAPRAKFTPPTQIEAETFALEIGFTRCGTWLDFYASNGWKVGRNPMKDWKACMRKWNREGSIQTNQKPQKKGVQFDGFGKLDYEAGLEGFPRG